MTMMQEKAAVVKKEMAAEAQNRVHEIVTQMVTRTRNLAEFDLGCGTKHEPSELFVTTGSHSLMFALHTLYSAVQDQIRQADAVGCEVKR